MTAREPGTSKIANLVATCGLALSLVLGACVDPDPADGSGTPGFSLLRLAQIELDPPERDVRLVVGGLPIGTSTRYTLLLRNTGERALNIRSIDLTYDGPDDETEPAFRLHLPADVSLDRRPYQLRPTGSLPGSSDSLVTEAPEELEVEIVFTHLDRDPRTALLAIQSDSRRDPEIVVVITTEQGFPVAVVTPDLVDFGSLQEGATGRQPLTVLNTGSTTLELSGFQMTGDLGFVFLDPESSFRRELSPSTEEGVVFDESYRIEPNRSRTFDIEYAATQPDAREARLVLFTNAPSDPDLSETGGSAIVRRLLANGRLPRIAVEPTEVDFGRVAVGSTALRLVRLLSHGSAPLTVTGLAIDLEPDTGFTLDLSALPGFEDGTRPTPARPLIIPENDFAEVRVFFTPEIEVLDDQGRAVAERDTLRIESDAFSRQSVVPLSGTGVIATCPIAQVTVLDGNEVRPQTVVRLRGDESTSSCGSITNYLWSVEQPSGAGSGFLPSPTFDNPNFPCDAAGTYRFCLDVVDSCGAMSCEPACEEVVAEPDAALHIQLLWHTPNAPAPSPDRPRSGGDLDLHLMHPFARLSGLDMTGDGHPDGWFHETYDCFWGNPRPDWGTFAPSPDDNPRLDRDDTTGPGPENINLPEPEDLSQQPPELVAKLGGSPLAYRAGVHYWNDHGYGPAYATLRVFVRGVLVYESAEVRLQPLDMWDAVTIEWPSGRVTSVPGPENGLLITPDYRHPAFVAP